VGKVEAGAPRERRYYKRVRWIGATTSWGVGLLVSLSLPFVPQSQSPPGAARPAAAPTPPAPTDLYDETWNVPVEVDRPIHLAATTHAVFVSGSSRVLALSLEDHHELWQWRPSEPNTITALAADDDHVLVGSSVALQSLDPAAGKVQWTTPQTGAVDEIVYRAAWVITTAGSALGAFRAADGSVVWQETFGSAVVGAPAIDGDAVFVVLTDGKLLRLSILSGEITWTKQLDGRSSPPFAANDRVYVSLSDGHFEAFHQQNGHLLWWYQFSGPSIGAAISDTKHVYVALKDNTIRALDRYLGNQRWQAQLTERPASGPLLTADDVLLPSENGEIGMAERKDGHVVARIAPPPVPADVPGVRPYLVAVATAPGDVILRLVANYVGDTTLTLAAYHRAPPKEKKKTPTTGPNPRDLR